MPPEELDGPVGIKVYSFSCQRLVVSLLRGGGVGGWMPGFFPSCGSGGCGGTPVT